jgi:uncharacterized protein YgiM (DUF1202 family)
LLGVAFLLVGMMKSFAWIFAVLSVFAIAWPSDVEAAQSGLVNAERVNVRTQPNILSEVVAQVNTGDKVQVLETIVHDKPIPGNPREWYRIGLPEGAVLWVAEDYIDSTNNTVTGSRLNVRAGPSESYTVVARLNRGDEVEPIKAVGGWISIKPPASAFAYVATSFIDLNKAEEKEQSSNPPVKTETIEPQNTGNTPVLIVDDPNTGETKVLQSTIEGNQPDNDEVPPVVQTTEQNTPPTPVETVIKENSQSVNRIQAEVTTNQEMTPLGSEPSLFDKVDQTPVPVVQEESGLKPIDSGELAVVKSDQVRLPSEVIIAENPSDPLDALKRIVTREGIVRRSRSIQSPTYHRLEDSVTHKTMNYLYTGRLHLHTAPTRSDLKPYEGYRIRVTGQESVDARWPKIPVIEIEELKLAD